jgi:hypothetical protein
MEGGQMSAPDPKRVTRARVRSPIGARLAQR